MKPKKPALLIIDMQKQHLDGQVLTPSASDVAMVVNYTADFFRKKNYPVIMIYDEEDCKKGDPKFEMIDALKVEPNDEKIHKSYGNSFRDTTLDARLKALGVDFLLIAGFKAEACVLATIHGAKDRDIPFALLRGGVISTSSDGASFVEKTYPLASYSVVTNFF